MGDNLAQAAHRLRVEGFIAGHGQIIFRREALGRLAAFKHGVPGIEGRRNIAASGLLTRQIQLAARGLLKLFGIIQRLQVGVLRRHGRQPLAPLGGGFHIAGLLCPERHQVHGLGVIGIHHQHFTQRLFRQVVVGFFMPVIGLIEQGLQRRIVVRRLGGHRTHGQPAEQAERRPLSGGIFFLIHIVTTLTHDRSPADSGAYGHAFSVCYTNSSR